MTLIRQAGRRHQLHYSRRTCLRGLRHSHRVLVAGLLTLTLGSCDLSRSPASTTATIDTISPGAPLEPAGPGQESLHPLGMQLLESSVVAVRQMRDSAEQLLRAPDSERMAAARDDLNRAANTYEQFYIFTRLGLIDPKHYQPLIDLHYQLAAWPIQPGYLDSFGDYAAAGIVYDIGLPLTEESLRNQHGLMDTGDVALGFYALEFVLFGEKNSRQASALLPVSQLTQELRRDGYESVDELPDNRRRQLIALQTRLIGEDLLKLHGAWQPTTVGTPGHHFASLSGDQRVIYILRAALAMLTEHIINITEHSKASDESDVDRFVSGKQLAGRLAAQLQGWEMVLQQAPVPSSEKLHQLIRECLDELDTIVDQPMNSTDGNIEPIDWRDTYSSLSTLANSVRRLAQGYGG